jgi:hypothetical protein
LLNGQNNVPESTTDAGNVMTRASAANFRQLGFELGFDEIDRQRRRHEGAPAARGDEG